MKKIFTLLFIVTVLTACQTEPLDPSLNGGVTSGTNPGNTTVSIEGNWLYTDVETITTTTTTIMGNTTTLIGTVEFVSSDVILTFNANGTYTAQGSLTIRPGTAGTTLGNQTQNINDSGTYSIANDVISFNSTMPAGNSPFGAGDVITTIDTLDATDLLLDLTGSSTQNSGGSTINIDIEGTADFERQ